MTGEIDRRLHCSVHFVRSDQKYRVSYVWVILVLYFADWLAEDMVQEHMRRWLMVEEINRESRSRIVITAAII
jgi:hypothetical protein